jgi:crossover junction endonuclease MUS81
MLDFIIERKRLDDLLASIVGNRYDAQKYHLRRCGIKNLMYLLEGDAESIPEEAHRRRVRTARVQTEIFDGFRVVNTESTNDTIDFFGNFTRALDATYAPLKRNENTQTLPSYPTFIKTCGALADSEKTLRTIWASMIAQVPGVGPNGAEAIAARYPTPSHLKRATDADRAGAQRALADAVVNARKLGPAAARNILNAFFPSR